MREYELVYIVSPEVVEEDLNGVVERVNQFISSRGGLVEKVDSWGKRRLAYPIGAHREGSYFLAQFKLDPNLAGELENSLRISEQIIRHLLVRLDGGQAREEVDQGQAREEVDQGQAREEVDQGQAREEVDQGQAREEVDQGEAREEGSSESS